MGHDRYNAAALVAAGNAAAARGDGPQAGELYLEAIGVQADCAPALYNLGALASTAAGGGGDGGSPTLSPGQATAAWEKLRGLAPGCPEVLHRLADAAAAGGDDAAAGRYAALLLDAAPSDAGAHALRGALAERAGDEAAALAAYAASARAAPTSPGVLAWLAGWHARAQLWDRAAGLYEHAAAVAVGDGGDGGATQWRLAVAGCLRRGGSLAAAWDAYAAVAEADPGCAEGECRVRQWVFVDCCSRRVHDIAANVPALCAPSPLSLRSAAVPAGAGAAAGPAHGRLRGAADGARRRGGGGGGTCTRGRGRRRAARQRCRSGTRL